MGGAGQRALVRVVSAGILWPTCAQTSPVRRWLAVGVSRLPGELRGRESREAGRCGTGREGHTCSGVCL